MQLYIDTLQRYFLKLRQIFRKDEIPACKICGGTSTLKEKAYNRTFYECNRCKFIFTTDYVATTLKRGMGLEGSWGGPGGGGYREYWLATFLSKELELRSILLFGTGATGTFPRLIKEGYDVVGSDISRDVIEMRRKEFGSNSFYSPEDLPSERKYDIIVCVEVFEHFFDPRKSFDLLATKLSKNGIICGTTNFYPGGSIVDTNDPGYMSHMGHVAYWSSESLGNIAKEYGLHLTAFEMIRPGSVLPDEKFGQLWPNKRVFFLHHNRDIQFFTDLMKKSPILPIDQP